MQLQPTTIDGVSVTGVGGFPSTFFGTSAAAPHAGAVAALILQADPSLTPAEVASLIQNTSTDRGSAGYDNTYGYGLVDALAAVDSLEAPAGSPAAVSVTPESGNGSDQTFTFLFSDLKVRSGYIVYTSVRVHGLQINQH